MSVFVFFFVLSYVFFFFLFFFFIFSLAGKQTNKTNKQTNGIADFQCWRWESRYRTCQVCSVEKTQHSGEMNERSHQWIYIDLFFSFEICCLVLFSLLLFLSLSVSFSFPLCLSIPLLVGATWRYVSPTSFYRLPRVLVVYIQRQIKYKNAITMPRRPFPLTTWPGFSCWRSWGFLRCDNRRRRKPKSVGTEATNDCAFIRFLLLLLFVNTLFGTLPVIKSANRNIKPTFVKNQEMSLKLRVGHLWDLKFSQGSSSVL